MRITNNLRLARRDVGHRRGWPSPPWPSALSLTAASAAPVTSARHSGAFTFGLVPSSPSIKSCLPHAGGRVTIIPGSQNDTMEVTIFGMPRNAEFDLFVIQQPNKPFGVSWYQTDVNADRHGVGHATVRGVFDVETFSVSTGGTTTFGATHQYHLGLWFNDPNVPFNLGCEPDEPSDKPDRDAVQRRAERRHPGAQHLRVP